MNWKRLVLFTILILSLVLLPACAGEDNQVANPTPATAKEVETEVEEAAEAVEGYSEAQSEEFEREASTTLTRLEAELEELRVQAEQATGEAKVELNRRIAELEPQAEALEKELAELRVASAEEWEERQPEVQRALDRLDQGLTEAGAFLAALGEAAVEELQEGLQKLEPELEREAAELSQEAAELELETETAARQAEVGEIQAKLYEYKARIDELEERAVELDGDVQTKLNEDAAQLRQQYEALEEQVDQLEQASVEDWQRIATDINVALDEFEANYVEARVSAGLTEQELEQEAEPAAQQVDLPRIEAKLYEYKARIDELEERAVELDGDAQTRLNEDIAELRQQRETLEEQFNSFKAATADERAELAGALNAAVESLEQSYRETTIRLEESS